MPPPRLLQQSNQVHNTNYNRVHGNQTNNHYGDITHISDSFNTITRNNYGSNNRAIHNSSVVGNSFGNQETENDISEKGRIIHETSDYPLSKSPVSHAAGLGPREGLVQHRHIHVPPLESNSSDPFIPQSQSYLPHDRHNQGWPEDYPPDLLLTPAVLAFMREMQTTTYNNIQGNQTIHTYYNQIVEKKHTIYDQYHNLISGDVYRYQDIHEEALIVYEDKKGETEVVFPKIFKVQVNISHAKVKGDWGYTAVSYQGRHAKKFWEHDFQQFAERGDAKIMQMFGINCHSSVPFLIFHGELIPLTQIVGKIQDKITTYLAGTYIDNIASMLNVKSGSHIWLDPRTGALIHGVQGPIYVPLIPPCLPSNMAVIPSSSKIEFLQKDVIWQYLLQMPLNKQPDRLIMDICQWMNHESKTLTLELLTPDQVQPRIVSTFTNSPIATGWTTWKIYIYKLPSFHVAVTTLQDGTTRFCLPDHLDSKFSLHSGDQYPLSWLSQALSVFYHLGISLDEDTSQFKLFHTKIYLGGEFDCSDHKLQRRKQLPFAYLFIRPILPSSARWMTFVSGWHYWSFDPSGQTSISDDMCRNLGLPTQLFCYSFSEHRCCYPMETYRTIHRWQVERGFNPKTTDLARYLFPGIPLLQVADNDATHFMELDDEDA